MISVTRHSGHTFGDRVSGRDYDRKPGLSDAAPTVVEEVAFEQNTLGILDLKKILGDEGLPRSASHKTWRSRHPDRRLEKVIVPDLDVGWRHRGSSSAEDDVLAGSLQEIVNDLEGTHRKIPGSSRDCLRVAADAGNGHTVEVGEKRVHNGHKTGSAEEYSTGSLVLCGAVHPHAIENNVICDSILFRRYKIREAYSGSSAGNLHADKAIVICAIHKLNGAMPALTVGQDFGENVLYTRAVKFRSRWQ